MRILWTLLLIFSAVCAVAAEIELPKEAQVDASTEDGKTWRQYGTMELT